MNKNTSQGEAPQASSPSLVSKIIEFPRSLGVSFLTKIGWFQSTLRMRIILFAILVMIAQALAATGLALSLYWADRKAYLFENHQLRSQLVFNNLKSTLLIGAKPQILPLRKYDPLTLQADFRIPRLPEGDEVFVGHFNNEATLFWRDTNHAVLKTPYRFLANSCPSSAGMCYLVSGNGLFLGTSHPHIITEKAFRERETFIQALKGGMRSGFRFVKTAASNQEVAVTFQEAPGTNIYVFIETTTSGIVVAAQEFIKKMIFLGLGGILLYAFVLGRILDKVLSPLRKIMTVFMKIREGQYTVDMTHGYNDEFAAIIASTKGMTQAIAAREKTILTVQNNLNEVLKVTHALTLAETIHEVIATAVKGIAANTDSLESTVAAAHFHEELSALDVTQSTIFVPLKNGVKENTTIKKTLTNSLAIESTLHTTKITQHGPLLIVPIFMQSGSKICTLLFYRHSETALTHTQTHYVSTLISSVAILFENLFQRERMKTLTTMEFEMNAAASLQNTLLSDPPNLDEWNLDTLFLPATKVGGDWYAFHQEQKTGMLYIAIGDATGHGLSSAMVAVIACGAFYASMWGASAKHQCTPEKSETLISEIMDIVSQSILRASNETILMTCLIVAINTKTGEALLMNGGHRPPLHKQTKTNKTKALVTSGDLLGLKVSVPRTSLRFTMEPQDSLLLYSDGLIENVGPQNTPFSSQKLRKSVDATPIAEPSLIPNIHKAAKVVWAEEPGHDDVTVLSVFRNR
jgi:serine phosphatase RsbU (regulator of sigma subunit)